MSENSTGIVRKCGCCGEEIHISKENINDAIYYDKKTYHSNCFIQMCEKRTQSKRKNSSQKWQKVLDNLDTIKKESYDRFNSAIVKDDVYNFMRDAYDITIIPSTIWQKLSNIYDGTFKGMINGIPPEHLLDMWQRKINMLNKTAARNVSIGKKMSTEQRLNYDLTILVNKYDSYLKWLAQQEILEADKESTTTESIITKTISYSNIRTNQESTTDTGDISDLVDDIFG